jgi:hypothetical protein
VTDWVRARAPKLWKSLLCNIGWEAGQVGNVKLPDADMVMGESQVVDAYPGVVSLEGANLTSLSE